MDTPKTIRASDEAVERFRALAKAQGMTQSAAFEAMMSVFELSIGTKSFPSVQDDIQSFQGAITLALQLYTTAITVGQNQREIAQAEVSRTLDSKDRIIADLQEQLENTKAKLTHTKELEAQLRDANEKNASVSEELDSLRNVVRAMPDADTIRSQEAVIADLKQQVAALSVQVAEKQHTIELLTAITHQRSAELAVV